MEKIEEVEKNLINEINIEEKNFRIEINEQSDRIKKLNVDIKRIEFKIKNLIQEKKMDEIKKKNRTKGRSTTKYQPNLNSTKNNYHRDNKKHLSNYKQRPIQNNNINNNLKNNQIINMKNRDMLRTPNFVVKNSERFTKPFEIKKFNELSNNKPNDDKNFTIFNDNKKLKLTSFNDNLNYDSKSTNYDKNIKKNNNKGTTALKEIEFLKNEIQNALKNNVVLLNNEDILSDNNNYNDREDKNNINNFKPNQTGGFENQINNNEKEKDFEERNEIEYNYIQNENNNYTKSVCIQNEKRIKDYQLNDKSNEEINKRKPFDKFNFNS